METTDSRLLSGILEEADKKATKILEDAEVTARSLLEDARLRSEREIETEKRATEDKLKQIRFRLQANMASAKRKANLRQIDESYQQVMNRVLASLDAKTVSKHLSTWIAEAAIGLDLKEAKVAFSAQCPVTEAHLEQARVLVKKATGSDITLHLEKKAIRSIGVVVSSLDDTISFNNQVEIRLRRFDRVVRSMIQERT
ncbi:MAG: ATPase [Spirochaetia bacterium]|jgi:V/A-type H+-transporting ATPase subunit E|nr:ATPase [Spirochaetia bacterium]NLK05219.1 ATPase [Spirochaetales bacterium]